MERKNLFMSLALFVGLFYSCTNESRQIIVAPERASEIIASDKDAIVQTSAGKVAGYVDNGVYTFKGIAYAEALRFMPPTQPKPWEGIKSCRAYGPVCPQGKRMGWYSDEQAFAFDWDDGFADENCLRINIWTKGISNQRNRPVMVWLHGGGYAAGSGQELPAYDGAHLSQKGDVVVVSLNHRLNVLGFLDLSAFGEKYAKSGNVGLLDLVAALQWVKSNISNFGGDPSNVTIFGQSGGGGKVSTLMVMPAARGLFQKAIVQSGSLLNVMEPKYSRRIGSMVMEELNLKASQIDELQKIPYEQLLIAGNKAVARVKEEAVKEGFNPFIFGWAPTVDGNVLSNQPSNPKALEQSKDIPLLVGTTLHEFTASTYNPKLRGVDIDFTKSTLHKKYGDKTDEFLTAFGKAYPGYKPQDLLDVDFIFRPGAIKQAAMKYAQKGAPVYIYLFTWESPILDRIFRSTHCMELPFVFDNIDRCRTMTGGGKAAYLLAEKMSSAWINFAKSGDPNVKGLPRWEPYTIESGATMFFDNTCELKYNHDKELLDIVNSFPIRGF
jgi:para-nitrobenzyl esterase